MLADKRMALVCDYVNSVDCFPRIDIAGGVNYFLWAWNHTGPCDVISVRGGNRTRMSRFLDEYDIFVRNNSALRIVREVLKDDCEKMDGRVYSRNVFGITSNEHGTEKEMAKSDLLLLNSEKGNSLTCSYISSKKVLKNADIVDKYKVIIGKVVPRNGEVGVDPKVGYRATTTVHIVSPGQVFTESYLLLATFDSLRVAENFARFMTCKFPRFVLHETYSSMNITKGNFRFVPFLDFRKVWTDNDLYERYQCSKTERKMIESTIRPLEYVIHDGKRSIKKSIFE
jgi:site-specific DNA-methyltransferase (adenine-specific)